MVFPAFRWRTSALLGALALLLPLALGCHKGSSGSSTSADTVTISGYVKFQRPPLLTDSNGIPTGLDGNASNFTMELARGVRVRIYQESEEKDLAGNVQHVWAWMGNTVTDANGYYSFSALKDVPTIVELVSHNTYYDSNGSPAALTSIFAEDMNSSIPEPNRRYYSLRKALDGNGADFQAATLPPNATADTTVNFNVNLNDAWVLSPARDSWTPADFVENATTRYPGIVKETDGAGTGSRVLAVADALYEFEAVYGNPTPAIYMDLHYLRGTSDPLGTYTDYDLTTYNVRRPQAYSSANERYTYFATVRGGPGVDDAFNKGVLFTMFGRNNLSIYSVEIPMPLALPGSASYLQDRQDLRPDLAVAMGFPEAMAAGLVKSPYLAETTGVPGGGMNPVQAYRDVRNISGLKRDPFSAPSLGALGWEVILKANSISVPSGPTDWANIKPLAAARFFAPVFPAGTNSNTNSTVVTDLISVFSQLTRLQESMVSTEPVDLKTIFTDSVITILTKPFNIPWPRPTVVTAPGSPYVTFYPFWGKDPDSRSHSLPNVTLSMAYARKCPYDSFGNYSFGVDDPLTPTKAKGEAYTAMMYISKDALYDISLVTSPAIPAGAKIRVMFGKASTSGTVSFGSSQYHDFGAGDSIWKVAPTDATTGASVTAVYVPIRIKLLSPDTLQPADIDVKLNMIPAN